MARRFLSIVFSFFIISGLPTLGRALDKIHVAHSSISGSQAILWVTQDGGFFKKNGLDITILFIAGGRRW